MNSSELKLKSMILVVFQCVFGLSRSQNKLNCHKLHDSVTN